MKSAEAFESILMLKNKFEEIKNNINNIEQEKLKKFEEFQCYQRVTKKFEYTRPASTSKLREGRAYERENSSVEDSRTIEALRRQVKELQESNLQQGCLIEKLKKENEALRNKVDSKVLGENNKKRPQSCLRNSFSSPKKERVTFAKDLIKVKYIGNEPTRGLEEMNAENGQETIEDKSRYETPIKPTIYERSVRGYLDESRAQMRKLNSMSLDNQFSDYFKDRSVKIASQILRY